MYIKYVFHIYIIIPAWSRTFKIITERFEAGDKGRKNYITYYGPQRSFTGQIQTVPCSQEGFRIVSNSHQKLYQKAKQNRIRNESTSYHKVLDHYPLRDPLRFVFAPVKILIVWHFWRVEWSMKRVAAGGCVGGWVGGWASDRQLLLLLCWVVLVGRRPVLWGPSSTLCREFFRIVSNT